MSADLVNLRQARKARARKQKDAAAAENRIKFGRTKAERERQAAADDLDRRRLAGHALDTPSAVERDD